MSLGELFGYIASVLVFTTFYMKTMVPLRLVAIASNVAFIIYALWGRLTPILILHVLLLPLDRCGSCSCAISAARSSARRGKRFRHGRCFR